ncbi:MAG: hypothetical protein BA871_07080 [Desulfuromonadales bacterium C00003096]|jgi:hypothetical protein|nr:MAG: hypothetical protein BA871_07080 [Desulfuromonadales bacterium C00003096]
MDRIIMIELGRQYIINESGEKTAVIIPAGEYEELLEDLHDLAVVAERRGDPTISFEELKEKLRKDGLL